MSTDPRAQKTQSVLWVPLNHPVTCEVKGHAQPFAATLTHLSEQGAYARSETDVAVGSFIDIAWLIRIDRPLRLPGQIVSMKETETTARLYGIRFVPLGQAAHAILMREILELDRRRKARPEKESEVAKKVASELGKKRAAYRVPVAFAARYGPPGEAKRPGKARNLSSSGIGFETIETFPVGAILEFALDLPTEVLKRAKLAPGGEKTIHGVSVRPFEKLNVRGRIVKAARPDIASLWEYGIAFIDPDPVAVNELRRYVHLSQLDALNKGVRGA